MSTSVKRGVWICGGVAISTLIFLSVSGIYLFYNINQIERKVEHVSISKRKKIRLTLKVFNDSNIYYQVYQGKYYDPAISQIKEGDTIEFYTTTDNFRVDKPILSDSEFNQFYYHPIFNINEKKHVFDFIFYYVFGESWLTILFYLSSAGTFFYLIPFVTITNWANKIMLIAIAIIWVWLFIL